jgi:hypothetical protein
MLAAQAPYLQTQQVEASVENSRWRELGKLDGGKEVYTMSLDWKPRGRDLVIGDIPWLARITDKARAKLDDTIGDYIYP